MCTNYAEKRHCFVGFVALLICKDRMDEFANRFEQYKIKGNECKVHFNGNWDVLEPYKDLKWEMVICLRYISES